MPAKKPIQQKPKQANLFLSQTANTSLTVDVITYSLQSCSPIANSVANNNLKYDDIIRELAGENGDHDVYDFYQDHVREFWREFITKLRETKIIPKRMPDEALMMHFDIWVQYFAEKRQQHSRINDNIIKELILQMRELFFFGMLDLNNQQQKKTLQEIYNNADLKEYNLE